MMLSYLHNAITACKQALTQNSDPVTAFQSLGHLLQGMGKFEEATHWHSQAVDEQFDRVDTYLKLGDLCSQQHQWHEAIALYQDALNLQPSATLWMRLAAASAQAGAMAESLTCLCRALELTPGDATAEKYFYLGNAFLDQANAPQALDCYQRATALDPQFVAAYHNWGEVLTVQGQIDAAIACYQTAVEHNPDSAASYLKLGRLLWKHQQPEPAKQALQRAIHLDPTMPWAYHALAEILLQQSQWSEVIQLLETAIALNHNVPWEYTYFGHALIEVGRRTEAIACHQTAARLRGWPQCQAQDYQFTRDWFTHNIPTWKSVLQSVAHQPGLRVLEVGSYEGMSTCWLLDHVLTHASAQITCIDLHFSDLFWHNIRQTGYANKVISQAGNSHDLLPALFPNLYSVIYLDGCHLADHIRQDATLAWPLLAPGGLMILDDYGWVDARSPHQAPKIGIDAFLATVDTQIKILHQGFQVILQKLSP